VRSSNRPRSSIRSAILEKRCLASGSFSFTLGMEIPRWRSVDGFLELLLHSHLPAGWSGNPWTELMYIHKLNWRTEISVREASFAFNFD